MKKLILILALLYGTVNVQAVELLVRAKPHWMDSLTQKDVDVMSTEQKQSYESRSQIGDVVVVRPDGWLWGNEECLPNFIIVKVPDMPYEEAKKYEESLNEQFIDDKGETQSRMLKVRKYQIPLVDVEEAKSKNGILNRTKAEKIKNIKEKTE